MLELSSSLLKLHTLPMARWKLCYSNTPTKVASTGGLGELFSISQA